MLRENLKHLVGIQEKQQPQPQRQTQQQQPPPEGEMSAFKKFVSL